VGQAKKFETQTESLSAHTIQPERTLVEEGRQNEALRAHLAQVKQALADQQRRNQALKRAKAKLSRALAQQRSQNEAMRRSTSWRVTLPIRALVNACRTLRRAVCRAAGLDSKETSSNGVNGPNAPAISTKRSSTGASRSPESTKLQAEAFFSEGFLAPVDLFTPAQCKLILKHHRHKTRSSSGQERKALAARDRFFYDLATRPALLALLRPLLGEDIVLWGARMVRRSPGKGHAWHTDIESSAVDGRFVSLWIGLENTSQASALHLISRSHKFGKPIQQVAQEGGLSRDELTNEMVIAWARERDSHAKFVQPQLSNGQAIVFDGRLWHGSNHSGRRTRSALLLQYAAAEMPIAFPDLKHLDWPFRYTSDAPLKILVSGRSITGTVPPPPACPAKAQPVTTHVHLGDGFLESDQGWKPYPLLRGPTPIVADMSSHVSVLSPGHSPHPPHRHVQEELLVVLKGEAEIVIPESSAPSGARVEHLVPGCFVYYPAYQGHTIRNASASPVTYLMFKWQCAPAEVERPLGTTIADIGGTSAARDSKPRSIRVLFEAPTAYLGKLHAHVTDLQTDGGYPPHADKYDVAILVFSGTIETLGKTVGPGGSIYYAAGEPHGMRNVGDEPARYLVFEFHGLKPPKEAR
jgi:mannose-6-phosphate isomerase-like protein (cupin superfamily)